MTAHTAITAADVWDAHTLACKARGFIQADMLTPCVRKCRGSQHTAEMRLHAARVTAALTGHATDANGARIILATVEGLTSSEIYLTCPLCVRRFSIADGQGDRALPGHLGGRYGDDNVAMVCTSCNLAREFARHDMDAYAADVRRASARVARSVQGVMRGTTVVTSSHRVALRGIGKGQTITDIPSSVALIKRGPYAK